MLKRPSDPGIFALNLSFVLHERSDSPAVQRAVRACQAHSRRVDCLDPTLAIPVSGAIGSEVVDLWMTANLGLPELLAATIGTSPDRVISVDKSNSSLHRTSFFRAPASLALPDGEALRVGVAALILRPGHRTSHLAVAGIHDWPAERSDAVRSLERLIQAHAGQWMPARALWEAPAETLLPDEV